MITLTFQKSHAVLGADCKRKLWCSETCYEAIGMIQKEMMAAEIMGVLVEGPEVE